MKLMPSSYENPCIEVGKNANKNWIEGQIYGKSYTQPYKYKSCIKYNNRTTTSQSVMIDFIYKVSKLSVL